MTKSLALKISMDKVYLKIFVIIFSLCCSFPVMAGEESYDFTTSIDAGISKKFFKRLRVGLTGSASLKENSTTLDKLSSKADVSYMVVRKVLKVGVSYYAIAKNRDNDFFFNQRFQGYTNVKYDINRFSFAWRSRYQMTYRPEKKEEKQWVNYWRNKFSFSAKIPKVPLYSSLAAELFYRTNNYKGNYITKLRYEGALKYEFDKKNSLKLYYQYDDPVNVKKLKNVSNLGLSYQFSF